jgi:hypothetical protein
MIFLECDEFGNVEMRIGKEIELALQVEIKQALRGAVRGDNAIAKTGIFRLLGKLDPILVAANFGGGRYGEWKASLLAGIFWFGSEDDVGDIV